MSIDYVLHLAHGYNTAHGDNRREKVEEALVHMGSALLGGAMTTAGATAFLFPSWIYLFHQMGVMLFANVIIALMFTFFFLSPLLSICGHSGHTGDIYYYIGQLYKLITGQLNKEADMEARASLKDERDEQESIDPADEEVAVTIPDPMEEVTTPQPEMLGVAAVAHASDNPTSPDAPLPVKAKAKSKRKSK